MKKYLSPVRIYVLWHPGFDHPPDLAGKPSSSWTEREKARSGQGLRLARQIYHWFRLENMEGIPVYFRSANAPGKTQPPAIPQNCRINYILPLVDAHMVSSPEWRAYVAGFLRAVAGEGDCVNRLLPVAVEPVAYNMPEGMRRLNFIRHDLSGAEPPSPEILIGRLTEVICRDLNAYRRAQGQTHGGPGVPGKLKIFLSHAKADDTREAVALKEYLQGETQCEAFFDETDIASGYDYADVLGKAIQAESAGLIVVQGDHYADRPWCRREIRDFLKPVREGAGRSRAQPAYFIPPVVVVQTMKGERVARTIPDLGHAPCLRWNEGAARLVVTTLLREILFGQFYCLIARDLIGAGLPAGRVMINRTPDPVMIERILADRGERSRMTEVIHPGYGLSSLEREGLQGAFPKLKFTSFAEWTAVADDSVETLDLGGRVLAVSVGNAQDILSWGAGDEHNEELLRRLLQPLFRRQVSLLYGGALPQAAQPLHPWEQPVNFTELFLHLLLSERSAGFRGGDAAPRLYNVSAWPHSEVVTPQVRAQWTDICSFIAVTPQSAGLGETPKPLAPEDPSHWWGMPRAERSEARRQRESAKKEYDLARKALGARCLSAMRRLQCGPMEFVPPDGPEGAVPAAETFQTLAHLYLGGKVTGALGVVPGIFEEVYHAIQAGKPLFLIGAGRGAAGLLADWLAAPPEDRPQELRIEWYLQNPNAAAVHERLAESPAAGLPSPADLLDGLWGVIEEVRQSGTLARVLNNTLSDEENRDLLTATSSRKICAAVWKGISSLAETRSVNP